MTKNACLLGRPKLTPGVDTPLFYLDAERRWRLASDGLQWIIQRIEGTRLKGPRAGEQKWQSVRFCTTPEVLLRDMRELGIKPTAEALGRIAEFPPHVAHWEWDGRPFEARPVAVEVSRHPHIPGVAIRDVPDVAAAEWR